MSIPIRRRLKLRQRCQREATADLYAVCGDAVSGYGRQALGALIWQGVKCRTLSTTTYPSRHFSSIRRMTSGGSCRSASIRTFREWRCGGSCPTGKAYSKACPARRRYHPDAADGRERRSLFTPSTLSPRSIVRSSAGTGSVTCIRNSSDSSSHPLFKYTFQKYTRRRRAERSSRAFH